MKLIKSLIGIIFIYLILLFRVSAQEYKVDSFEILPNDLTARTESRVDGNGRKCGVIKIYVKDDITDVSGPVVGEVVDKGFEKWIYVSHDSKQIALYFSQHMPLHIVFDDFNYSTISGNMTYALTLIETGMNNLSNENSSTIATSLYGSINGHDYVDLGLPSKTMWATCNIGAGRPEFNGNYFAWGETSPKSSYEGKNSNTYGKTKESLISTDVINSLGDLTSSYDAASVNWGNEWRMPTKCECDELVSSCKWEWSKSGGVEGYRITGPSGAFIFLPASGYKYQASEKYIGKGGGILSSSLSDGDAYLYCYGISFEKNQHYVYRDLRYEGRAIRPVLAKDIVSTAENNNISQQQNASDIYLNNAYSALREGCINEARIYYEQFKEISGRPDKIFELELSKADGSYIWSEQELLEAGFRIPKNFDDNFNEVERNYVSKSTSEGDKGLIEDSYKDAKIVYGQISDGFVNGLALLYHNDELFELAYICKGKIMAPSVWVFESPMMVAIGQESHEDYKNTLWINEDIVMPTFNVITGEGDGERWIPYLKQIYSPDIVNKDFIYNFSLGDVDMDIIRKNFNNFIRNGNRIPSHIWGRK